MVVRDSDITRAPDRKLNDPFLAIVPYGLTVVLASFHISRCRTRIPKDNQGETLIVVRATEGSACGAQTHAPKQPKTVTLLFAAGDVNLKRNDR